ncbi:hypothetical protein [Brevibacillus centrosporus]|jgi:hypothetical protein|nr:hypothetical protein [Brevibacillus centrosporus]
MDITAIGVALGILSEARPAGDTNIDHFADANKSILTVEQAENVRK